MKEHLSFKTRCMYARTCINKACMYRKPRSGVAGPSKFKCSWAPRKYAVLKSK